MVGYNKISKEGVKRVILVLLGDPRKPDAVKPLSVFDDDDFYEREQLKANLNELKEYEFIYLDNHDTMIQDIMRLKDKIDFVLNLCDEGFNNDAKKESHIPALLEILSLPYTGSGPQCLTSCYDKSIVKGIASSMNIPIPKTFIVNFGDIVAELPFNFPVFVKPNFGDGGFGIIRKSFVKNIKELNDTISEIKDKFGYSKQILVEEFLPGKDLIVGIVGERDNYNVLPIIEEDYSSLPKRLPKISGYEAKWIQGSPYWPVNPIQANISDDAKNFIIEKSIKLFERLECRDYCKLDWRLDAEGNPKLLEVNPNPGWGFNDHLQRMAKILNYSYSQMLGMILQTAENRLFLKSKVSHKKKEALAKV